MTVFSLLFLAAFLVLAVYLVRRRPAVFAAGFFLLFPLIYRAIDITYLDFFGPIYASEVNRFVGGNGAAPMFIYSACALVFPLLMTFPDTGNRLLRIARETPVFTPYHRYVSQAAFIVSLGMLAALGVNFVLVGATPILEGIDRLAYNDMAGPVHNVAYELNFLINFSLGSFTVLSRLNGRDYDLRFAVVMIALLFYWVVTGNRYSVFFVQLSFYFMPLAAVIIATKAGRISGDNVRSFLQRALTSRTTRVVGAMGAILMLGGLLLNSYFNVRDYREPLVEIQERVLVQPVQLWATSWDRVEFDEVGDPFNDYAINEIILNPIDPTRSTTIQYLMTLELGFFRSAQLAELGQAYNGGYPEVHFELFGAWLPLLTMVLAGLLTALFIRLCIMLLYRNMVASAITAVYLYFGISLHYASGSVTFYLAPTYWIKVGLFLLAYIFERQIIKRASERALRAPKGSHAAQALPATGLARR